MRLRQITLIALLGFFLLGAGDEYRRSDWPHWAQVEGTCRDTRQEVLFRDAEPGTAELSKDGCQVLSGAWRDVYSGALLYNPSLLDIDHVVALKDAHESGGKRWPREKKQAYANDLTYRHHLKITLRGVNREKGAKGPHEWLPPDETRRCEYVQWRTAIKISWELKTTSPEAVAIRKVLKTCGNAANAHTDSR